MTGAQVALLPEEARSTWENHHMTFAPGGPHRQEAWLFQDALTPPSPPIPQRLLCWDRTVLLHSPTALIRPLKEDVFLHL